jgi:hypothetical protein
MSAYPENLFACRRLVRMLSKNADSDVTHKAEEIALQAMHDGYSMTSAISSARVYVNMICTIKGNEIVTLPSNKIEVKEFPVPWLPVHD